MAGPGKLAAATGQVAGNPGKVLRDSGQVAGASGKSRGIRADSRLIRDPSRVTCKDTRVNQVLAPPGLAKDSHARQWCAIQLPVRTLEPGEVVQFVHAMDALRRLEWAA